MSALDLAPLERYFARRHGLRHGTTHTHATIRRGFTDGDLAGSIGVTRSTVCTWRRRGIPFHAADRACVALGVHVLNIWPGAYDEVTS